MTAEAEVEEVETTEVVQEIALVETEIETEVETATLLEEIQTEVATEETKTKQILPYK